MNHLPELDQYTVPFAQAAYEPLRVTFNLAPNSHMVSYDQIHFDGLLARALVERATEGHLIPDCEKGYWIPLPLKMLWRSEAGFPLWAASILYPVGPNVEDTYIRHKRNSDGSMHNKANLTTRNGPWMERRMPTPTRVCNTYEARCIGNKELVQSFLANFTHIGKLRLARVRGVTVDSTAYTDEEIWQSESKLLRPMPAATELLWPSAPSLCGWTPPYWKPSLFMLGWRVGTFVSPFNRGDTYDLDFAS